MSFPKLVVYNGIGKELYRVRTYRPLGGMMRKIPLIVALVFLATALPLPGQSPDTTITEEQKELRVATRHAPPFAIRSEDGRWSGISIDLWRDVAGRLGLDYTLEEAGLEEMLDGVASGQFDAGVGALSVTSAREETLDFTHPFHTSGLGIATTISGHQGAIGVLFSLVSWQLASALGALALVLFASGAIVWFIERRVNSEHFAETGWRGLFDGFYWSATTMATVGYGDKAPKTFIGKLIAIVWMFAGVMLISSFTASIASALTTIQFQSEVNTPGDLVRVPVATVQGSTAEMYLRTIGVRQRSYCEVIDDCVRQLAEGEVRAVVYDAPVMRYVIGLEQDSRLYVLPERLRTEDYAFALPNESPLREPVNRALLEITRDPSWRETLSQYLE